MRNQTPATGIPTLPIQDVSAAVQVDLSDLNKKVQKHDLLLRGAMWLAGILIASAIGSWYTLVSSIYSRGELDGAIRVRLEQIQKDQETLAKSIERLERSFLFPRDTRDK